MLLYRWFGKKRKPVIPYVYREALKRSQDTDEKAQAALALPQDGRPLMAQIRDFIQSTGFKALPVSVARYSLRPLEELEEQAEPGTEDTTDSAQEEVLYRKSDARPDIRYSSRGTVELEDDAQYSLPRAAPKEMPPPKRLDAQWQKQYSHWQIQQDKLPTFREFILDSLARRQMDAVSFYTAADIDRKLFSRMKNEAGYHPSKDTAIRCCLALRLDLDTTVHALALAGYSLSWSMPEDLAVRWCVQHGIYRVYEVMEVVEGLKYGLR